MGALSVYFDASVLVSFFTEDSFSSRADQAFRGHAIIPAVSDFGAAEFASAVARHVRMQILSAREAREVFSDFDAWVARTAARIETTPADIRAAEAILRRLNQTLRTPDAIHIAIAQRIGAELATFDIRMLECAAALGTKVYSI